MSDAGSRRDIELRIRAQDLTTADLKNVSAAIKELTKDLEAQVAAANKAQVSERELTATLTKLDQATKALVNIQGLIDTFKRMPAAISAAEASVAAAGQKLSDYRQQLETTGTTSARAEAQLTRLVNALSREEAQLAKNRQAYSDLSATLQKSGVDTERLVQAESDLRNVADLAGTSITRLSAAKLDLTKNIRLAREETARLAQEQRAAATAAEALSARFTQEAAAAKQQANVTEQLRAAQQKQVADLRAFNEQTRALTRQHNEDQTRAARDAVNQLRQGQTNPVTGGRGEAAAPAMFGLKPYELVNLSYQINDVISGVAMGQNLIQIFAQQAGQFFQIFGTKYIVPMIDFVKKFWLEMAVGAAAVGVAIAALNSAFRDIDNARQFGVILKLNADGARYSSDALVKLTHDLHDLGISFGDASKIIQQAIATGLNQDQIKNFAEAARVLADVKGIPVTDAFKALTEAAKGGVEGVRAFNDTFDILDATELSHLRTQKDVAAAIDLITKRLIENRNNSISPATRAYRDLGIAWENLVKSFGESGAIQAATSVIKFFTEGIDNAAKTVGALTELISALNKKAAELKMPSLGEALSNVLDPFGAGAWVRGKIGGALTGTPETLATSADVPLSGRFTNPRGLKIDTESLQQLAKILGEASKALPEGYTVQAISTERPGALVAGTNRPSEHSFGRAIDVRIVDASGTPVPGSMGGGGPLYQQLDKAVEAAANGVAIAIGSRFSKPDAGHYSIGGREAGGQDQRTVTDAEVGRSRVLTEEAERRLKIQYDLDTAKAREAVLADARIKAEGEGLKDTEKGLDITAAINRAGEQFDRERQKKDIDFRHTIQQLDTEAGKNKAAIDAAGDAARQKAIKEAVGGLVTLDQANQAQIQGMQEALAQLRKQDQANEEVKTINNQLASLRRQTELKDAASLIKELAAVEDHYVAITAAIDKASKNPLISKETIDGMRQAANAAKELEIAQARVNAAQAAGKEALTTRNTLVQTYNELAASGDITVAERERKIKEAFDLTRPSILAAADALQQIVDTNDKLSPEKVALYTAQIAKLRAEAIYVSPLFTAIKGAIENAFTTGLSTAFNTVTSAVGGLIAGTQRWKDVLTATRTAALQFFADLLKSIAEAILKYEALKLASSLFGIGGGGGSSGGGIGGIIGSLFGGGGDVGLTSAGTFFGDAAGATSAGFVFPIAHSGGVFGQTQFPVRPAPASWFANAPRYHTGSVVGLAPDEQAAILQRGEEILSRSSPRNIMNGGGSSKQDLNIRNILVMDESGIPAAMAGSHGERVTMSHITRNIATIRQYVKG